MEGQENFCEDRQNLSKAANEKVWTKATEGFIYLVLSHVCVVKKWEGHGLESVDPGSRGRSAHGMFQYMDFTHFFGKDLSQVCSEEVLFHEMFCRKLF